MRIKIVKVIHLPGTKHENESLTFQIIEKSAVLYDGFERGPIFSSKNKIKKYIVETLENKIL